MVEIRITLPDQIGKFVPYTVRSRKGPTTRLQCLFPGQTRPSACPAGS